MGFEVFEVAEGESRFVGGGEDDLGSEAGVEGFLPAWGTEAPAVAGLEAGEAPLQVGRGKVVADRLGERQEVGRHDDANGMRADVFGTRIAVAIAEKAGHRRRAASCQLAAEDVLNLRPLGRAIGGGDANHGALFSAGANGPPEPNAGAGV